MQNPKTDCFPLLPLKKGDKDVFGRKVFSFSSFKEDRGTSIQLQWININTTYGKSYPYSQGCSQKKKKYSPKKLMKAFVSEGQQVSKQSLRAAFDFSQSAVRTPASAISIKQSCLAF